MNYIEIVTTSEKKYLDQIEHWLKDEYDEKQTGFYINWNLIVDSFNRDKIFFLILDNNAIGFLTWNNFEIAARIDIAEIRPKFRGAGYGRELANFAFNEFRLKNFLAVTLECSPPESEYFWKAMGFIPNPAKKSGNLKLFRILDENYSVANTGISSDLVIELWDCQPHLALNEKPTWYWNVEYDEDNESLIKPIIFPCLPDWQIQLRSNDTIIEKEKAKYFGEGDLHDGEFIVIYELSRESYVNKAKKNFQIDRCLDDSIRMGLLTRNKDYPVYKPFTPNRVKKEIKTLIKKFLLEIRDETIGIWYREEQLLSKIESLAQTITNKYVKYLHQDTFRYGISQKIINLFLKYLWVIGEIEEPIHCPIDNIVRQAIIKQNPTFKTCSWTEMTKETEYLEYIDAIISIKKYKTIAEWELDIWNNK